MRFLGIKSFWPLFIKTQLHVWPDIRPFSKNRISSSRNPVSGRMSGQKKYWIFRPDIWPAGFVNNWQRSPCSAMSAANICKDFLIFQGQFVTVQMLVEQLIIYLYNVQVVRAMIAAVSSSGTCCPSWTRRCRATRRCPSSSAKWTTTQPASTVSGKAFVY